MSGLSLLLVASALGRVGSSLDDERVVARAGWVQAFAIASGSAQVAVVFTMASAGGSRSAESGFLVVLGLFVVALGTTLTAVVLHALLVGETRAAVLTHAGGDLRAG